MISVIALLSLTKEAILLISILLIFSLDKFITKLYFKKLILMFFGIMYLVLSLFYISFKANEDVFNNKSLLIDEPIISNNGINVYGTTYFAVLNGGYLIFKDNYLTGIGINNFQSELKNLVKKKYYPEKFELYRPTDSYLGIASELGFLYILFLILLFYTISKIVRITNYVNSHPLILLLIYFLFESVCLGSFHFRHYYIFFAILPFLLKQNEQKIATSHI
ncbi:MAG: hypothetical protein IPH57_12625 [Saprospiraceae bacterium]|nr:hypothetical protein [Saprospiraceae bacterium]